MGTKLKTLYDNYNIQYDEWFDGFLEFCEINDIPSNNFTQDSEEFFNWIHEELAIYWEDFKLNLKYDKENNSECVVIGSVGRWNGNFEIKPRKFNTLQEAIDKCVYNCDYIIIKEEMGVIRVIGIHHDGRHSFTIHRLNSKGCHLQDTTKLYKDCYHRKFNIQY